MPRALWKGAIAFGLVQIPVALYPAEQSDELSFDWLDKRDFSPVGYERINKRTGKRVEWKNIVKGYEHADGEYVVLTDADIEQANVEASHTLDIDRFVDLAEVDTVYFEKPYYVVPEKNAHKAYALLLETLEKTGKAALAKYVVRTRQHVGLLFPKDGIIVLMQLRYSYELRSAKELLLKPTKKPAITAKERQIAKTLVENMSGKWEPEVYRDEFRDDIMSLIKKRVKAGEVNTVPETTRRPAPRARAENVIDLVGLLKQSLEKTEGQGKSRQKKHKPAKRRAHAPAHRKSA